MKVIWSGILLIALASPYAVWGESPLRFKQTSDGAPLQVLTAPEIETLGDPLFNLLLKDKADKVKLSDIEDQIQPAADKRRVFVVSERIVDDKKTGSRRTVLAFDGVNGGETLKGNVMLSVFFGPDGFPEETEIEAWGWDNHRERYNYYKLDSAGMPGGALGWKFRASSDGADLLRPSERAGSCLRCHVVGAPVMKELAFPWNNWHAGVGGSFRAEYLNPNSAGSNKWPVAASERLKQLATADQLEVDFLIPAYKRFDQSRLNRALKRDDVTGNRAVSTAGKMTVLEGRRLLRSLFQTMEVNLSSSSRTSGLHPFGKPMDFVPTLSLEIPNAFFLNANLIAGGGSGGFNGLKLAEAKQFQSFANLSQEENKELVEKFDLRVNGRVGDTHFGWFTPEPGFVDCDLIDKALKLGVITPHFLAAALAVDVETPVFSTKRPDLLSFVPDSFEFFPSPDGTDPLSIPRDASKDLLTAAVIQRIDDANPAPGTAAAEFRQLLATADAVSELRKRVTTYASRIKAELSPTNAARRKAELERLYRLLVERRRLMTSNPVLKNLDETGGQLLLPLPLGG